MAPARRHSNGRSPLVNQQRQITTFFSKSPFSSSTSPSPVLSRQSPKSNPKPDRSPSRSPTTPSPVDIGRKKPVLVIGASPTSPSTRDEKIYAEEVVDRRVRVYWPLDQTWYEGCVKSFNKVSGKHLIQYDDSEEELLDLSNEKIEWIGEKVTRRFRRLRRVSVVEEEEDEEVNEELEEDDDSADEDWGKNLEPEAAEDLMVDMELVDEDDDEEEKLKGKSTELGKRKKIGGDKVGSSKKHKCITKAHINGNVGKMKQPEDNSVE